MAVSRGCSVFRPPCPACHTAVIPWRQLSPERRRAKQRCGGEWCNAHAGRVGIARLWNCHASRLALEYGRHRLPPLRPTMRRGDRDGGIAVGVGAPNAVST
jgi:hypothetical protein